MEIRPLQPENALFSMLVTLLGIVMEVRPVQPEKAKLPIEVMVLGIVEFLHPFIRVLVSVSMIALQLLRESYLGLPASIFIEARLVQPEKR